MDKTLILGVGNIIRSDDGFGVYVVRSLKASITSPEVEIREAGTSGLNMLYYLEGCSRLIIVDAVMLNVPAGEIFILDGTRLKEEGKNIISFHQVGVIELIQMAELIGLKFVTFLLGTRPVTLDWGTKLSPKVQKACLKAVKYLETACLNNFANIGSNRICIP